MPKDKYEGLIEEKVEQSVIGSVLIDGDSIKEVADFLKPDHFYKEANRIIYKTLLELYKKGQSIDLVTAIDQLKNEKKLKEANGNAPQDIDLIIVKNRYNPPRTIPLIFNGEFSTFTEK